MSEHTPNESIMSESTGDGNTQALFEAALQALPAACDAGAAQRLARYHTLLCEWNQRMNLTGDTAIETAMARLYLDSLAPLAAEGLFPRGATLIDVGSGAGFPGLPLAIARPDLNVLLLDSLGKRVTFLREVIAALALPNARAVHARAEDAGRDPALREAFDIALARAVAPTPVLLELLLPFARVGGAALCYKGPSASEELAAGGRAATLLGGGPLSAIPVAVPGQPEWQHCVLRCEKYRATPALYPRKAGTPERAPLGG